MCILGVRCSSSDFSYVVIRGPRSLPEIIASATIAFPKGFSRSQELKWLAQELESLVGRHKPRAIGLKGTEGQASRGAPFVRRVENEAIAFLVAAENGITHVVRRVNSSIAKGLGLKGKARYLTTHLDTSAIAEYTSYPDKVRDALLVAWSLC